MIAFETFLNYFAGKALPEDAMRIEEWVAASADNESYFKSLHNSWLESGDEMYHAPEAVAEWEAFKQKHQPANSVPFKPGRNSWLSKAAAVAAIVLVAVAGYYVFNTDNQNQETIIAAAGEKTIELTLKDGSKVTLKPDAELVSPVAFKTTLREVTLVGNGSFAVAHNAQQPFLVHLGDTHVKVLGTSFDITRKVGLITVAVRSGKVAFYNKADTITITAGETGKYLKSEKKFVLEQEKPIYGSFHFDNKPLNEVVAELNSYFKVNIQLQNKSLAQCRISAGFDKQNLDYILTAITETFNLSYKIDRTEIYINGKACE